MKRYICEGLAEYLAEGYKPWHMPGHKRKNCIDEMCEGAGINLAAFLAMDVTEVSGTDDLHHPQDMILKSQQQLSQIYDSYKSYYMVNGSTGGILSAIGAVADCGKMSGKNKIIIARNSHKSVYNAVKLFGLEPIIVEPEYEELKEGYTSYIYGGITAQQIKEQVEQHQDVCAVVITSPTYEGVVSEVSGIRKVLKPCGIPFIVDEAHGAHLSFIDGIFQLPLSALALGADIVIQSLHKTLPALTQTAVLHINDGRYEAGIKKYLSVFMSSSPSYPLLCSMEEAVVSSWERKQQDGYDEYLEMLRSFKANISKLRNIMLLDKTHCDETRIVLYGNWSGELMASRLRELGSIEIEMSGVNYVVLISTYVDGPEDFSHLEKVLHQLDDELDVKEFHIDETEGNAQEEFSPDGYYKLVGTVARENIYVYPPGSYIVAAGEEITQEAMDKLMELKKSGKKIVGL